GRSPRAWYALIACICALGVALIVYSREEYLHPYHAPPVPPTASDHWYAALGIDLCGKMQPDLAENPNFSTVGIRTAGDGVILIAPGAVTNSSTYTGKNDTLGTFALSYPGLTLTATSIQLPGAKSKPFKNGDSCTSAIGPADGKARLVAKVWSSPHASTGNLYNGNLTKLKLNNQSMITLAFVPKGTKLPEPPSKGTLIDYLNGTAVSSTPTTAPTTTSTTTTTLRGATTTTVAGATTTTPAGATTTLAGATTSLAPATTAGRAATSTVAAKAASAHGTSAKGTR
ncbi:MAG TPA: hypothetical protein VMD59_17710, partial [Acidimicrobiales bacterium]|nr:hypothetical protein [Acidimicrobiales bacterium]